MADESFEGWAVVEIMGHQKFAGHVSEQTVAGHAFVRIDVPAVDGHPAFTKLFGGASIYGITPVAEDVAKAVAVSLRKAPMDFYDLPDAWRDAIRESERQKLPAPQPVPDEPDFGDDDDYYDEGDE